MLRTTPPKFLGRSSSSAAQVSLVTHDIASAYAIRGAIAGPCDFNLKPFVIEMSEIFLMVGNCILHIVSAQFIKPI